MESQKYVTSPKKRLLVKPPPHLIKKPVNTSNRFLMKDFGWNPNEGTRSFGDMRRNMPETLDCPAWDKGTVKTAYNPKVKVNNWEQNSLQNDYSLTKNIYKGVTFPDPLDHGAARNLAFQTRMKNETGVSRDYIFKQDDTLYDQNLITMYDENYNQRWREKQLPEMRSWNFAHLAWVPEKTDHPLFGQPTQFGLFETMKKKWKQQIDNDCHTYKTIYQKDYLPIPCGDHYSRKRCNSNQQPIKLSPVQHLPKPSVLLKPIC